MLDSDSLGEVYQHRIPVRDQDIVLAKISMHQLGLIVEILHHLNDLVVPRRCCLKRHLAKMGCRDPVLGHVDRRRNGQSRLFCQLQVLELFGGPLIDKRPRVVWDILESGIAAYVLEAPLSEYRRACKIDLYSNISTFHVDPAVNPALLSGLYSTLKLAEPSPVQ